MEKRKNCWIIPTDQPSRLHYYYSLTPQYALSKEPLNWRTASHLYVTSDEEIKEGDYYLGDDDNIYNLLTTVVKNGRKIVLTTDQRLIKDGVQDIDDDFLKWFVKNPTCEFVEVQKWTNYSEVKYKIIISQEEPKQESHICKYCNTETTQPDDECYAKPKQETLEEAAKEFYPPTTTDLICSPKLVRDAFIAGGNYMAERMYSEEDMIAIVEKSRKTGLSAEYLLLTEQFKKK